MYKSDVESVFIPPRRKRIMNIKVGDKLYYWVFNRADREHYLKVLGTVSKIGRKFFYLKSDTLTSKYWLEEYRRGCYTGADTTEKGYTLSEALNMKAMQMWIMDKPQYSVYDSMSEVERKLELEKDLLELLKEGVKLDVQRFEGANTTQP